MEGMGLRKSGRSEWMKCAGFSAGAMCVLVIGGCATGRRGVIADLPGPVVGARTTVMARTAPSLRSTRRPLPLESRVVPGGAAGWHPRGGVSDRWTHIIVHHSGGPSGNARCFDNYHRNVNGWDELGYHFVIGNGSGSGDGEIEVGPRWFKQKHGAHCKTPDNRYNDHGIGICLVGDFTNRAPTAAQMASLARLTSFLMRECDISPDNVVTHGGVTGRTACPGARFPFTALRRSLASYSASAFVP